MSLFFYQIVLLLFLSKTDVLFCIFLILSKTITLTCFNNIRKTNSEKMKKYVIETQSIRWDQFNLLVNGPHRPYFKQKQKHNITKFWLTGFFLNLIFSAFWKKKRRHKTWQSYINNQNQETFIVIIINYKLRVFLLCLICKILFLKKYRPWGSNNIFILPTNQPFFFVVFFCCLARKPKN